MIRPSARGEVRRPRLADDRGVTLVETAIVASIVFVMFLAIFEFGLLFRDNLTAADAVADAVRIGAVVGPDTAPGGENADFAIVKAVREGLSSLNDDQIETIVVFKAGGSSDSAIDQVPVACRAGTSLSDLCNAYDASDAFAAVEAGDTAYFVCAGPETAACAWDPKDRKDGPKSSDVETIGVYVRIERGGYTGLFGNSWTIDRAMTLRLEPGVLDP